MRRAEFSASTGSEDAVGRHVFLNDRHSFFAVASLQHSHSRPCDACRCALGKGGIMHSTLSPSWKKRLLLALISVVALAIASSTTSRAQSFQGLGFVPGYNYSEPTG